MKKNKLLFGDFIKKPLFCPYFSEAIHNKDYSVVKTLKWPLTFVSGHFFLFVRFHSPNVASLVGLIKQHTRLAHMRALSFFRISRKFQCGCKKVKRIFVVICRMFVAWMLHLCNRFTRENHWPGRKIPIDQDQFRNQLTFWLNRSLPKLFHKCSPLEKYICTIFYQ